MGRGSPADRGSVSRHDLVIGNPVLGWSRVALERKILFEAQEVLIPVESVGRQVPRPAQAGQAGSLPTGRQEGAQ